MNSPVRNDFDAAFYLENNPDVAASGMDPEEHYLRFGREEGRAANANEAHGVETEHFDAEFYLASNPDVAAAAIDPYEHYVRFGKAEGRRPAPPSLSSRTHASRAAAAGYPEFDADFYFEAFPDIAASGISAIDHYLQYGRYERRVSHALDLSTQWRDSAFDSQRETFIVVSHDASRTGAPVLALNICMHLAQRFNVIAILLADGPLRADFERVCNQTIVLPTPEMRHPLVFERLVRDIDARSRVRNVIVNSIESRMIVAPFAKHGHCVLLLVHEYLSYTHSRASSVDAINRASAVVFSADVVRDDAFDADTRDALASSVVLRQGKSIIPAASAGGTGHEGVPRSTAEACRNKTPDTVDEVEDLLRSISPRPRLVLGAGTVQFRKGVDLFFATAAELKRRYPLSNALFVWVGSDPGSDLSYTACLDAQLRSVRRGDGHACLMGPTDRLETLYALADVFFLASRMDPLPNVAIDAMSAGLPVLCFEGTGGIPEILGQSAHRNVSIVPFANTAEAANRIARLCNQDGLNGVIGAENRSIAQSSFDMHAYVDRLVELLHKTQEAHD